MSAGSKIDTGHAAGHSAEPAWSKDRPGGPMSRRCFLVANYINPLLRSWSQPDGVSPLPAACSPDASHRAHTRHQSPYPHTDKGRIARMWLTTRQLYPITHLCCQLQLQRRASHALVVNNFSTSCRWECGSQYLRLQYSHGVCPICFRLVCSAPN